MNVMQLLEAMQSLLDAHKEGLISNENLTQATLEVGTAYEAQHEGIKSGDDSCPRIVFAPKELRHPCPCCGDELQIPVRAEYFVDRYKEPTTTITECCGGIVKVKQLTGFSAWASDAVEDAWGQVRTDKWSE